ncbi:hypothetical protein A2U01_0113915, partial [Trifolium medium]|nr:hypothetical protein [Trifolium medium]
PSKSLGQRGIHVATVPDDPQHRKEAEASQGPGRLGEESIGVRALGETWVCLETHHVARNDMRDTLRGD